MREVNVVTVLGGNGTIGKAVSAIFASFGGAKVNMVGRDPSRLKVARREAAASVRAGTVAKNLVVRTYDELGECVSESDLVFEAVSEELSAKVRVLASAAVHLQSGALLCSGTSGLSIEAMAGALPEEARDRMLGVHFFNPPYAMALCEVIPSARCDARAVVELCSYLRDVLRREVVVLRDKPAFLANRVGFQFINSAMQLAEKNAKRGGVSYADALLGPFTGRAMPPIATADFVGLDVTAAIVDNVSRNAHDWASDSFMLPDFGRKLVSMGLLGRKVGKGAYAKDISKDGVRSRLCYDIENGRYVRVENQSLPFRDRMVEALREGDYVGAMRALVADDSDDARACLARLVEYVIYGVEASIEVGSSVHDADVAMASGFAWCPPLALADAMSLCREFPDVARELSACGEIMCPQAEVERLVDAMEPSKYDYRPFLRAKA